MSNKIANAITGTLIPSDLMVKPYTDWIRSKASAFDEKVDRALNGEQGYIPLSGYFIDGATLKEAIDNPKGSEIGLLDTSIMGMLSYICISRGISPSIDIKSNIDNILQDDDNNYSIVEGLGHVRELYTGIYTPFDDSNIKMQLKKMIQLNNIKAYTREPMVKVHSGTEEFYMALADVCDDIGSIRASAAINIAALETIALTKADDIAANMALFSTKIQSQLGQVTSKTADYISMVTEILANNTVDGWTKLRSLFKAQEVETTQTGFTNLSQDITGTNPLVLYLDNIPIEDILDGVTMVVSAALTIFAGPLAGLVAAGVGYVAKKAVGWFKTVVNPVDIRTNDSFGDYSFNEGVMELGTYSLTNYPQLRSSLIEHDGEYMVIPTIGATWYLSIDPNDNGLAVIHLKKHMYDYSVAYGLYGALAADGNTEQDVINFLGANGLQAGQITITDDSDEGYLYDSLKYSEILIYAGVLALSPDGRSNLNRYYQDQDNYNDNHIYLFRNNRTGEITNAHWADELTSYNHSSTAFYRNLFKEFLLGNIEDGLSSDEWMPYFWSVGQVAGAYSVKTDSENKEAVGNLVKMAVGAAVMVTALVVSIKVKKSLKRKAYAAQREADIIAFDPSKSDEEAYRANRKANFLNTLAGFSFSDLLPKRNNSEPTSKDASKNAEQYYSSSTSKMDIMNRDLSSMQEESKNYATKSDLTSVRRLIKA